MINSYLDEPIYKTQDLFQSVNNSFPKPVHNSKASNMILNTILTNFFIKIFKTLKICLSYDVKESHFIDRIQYFDIASHLV